MVIVDLRTLRLVMVADVTTTTSRFPVKKWTQGKIYSTIAHGGDSQNFLGKFERFFVTLGLKILRLFRLKVLFEADIIKGGC